MTIPGELLGYIGQQVVSHAATFFVALLSAFALLEYFKPSRLARKRQRFLQVPILFGLFLLAVYAAGRMMWYGLLASTIMNDTSVAENVTSFGIYWQHIGEVARGTSSFLGQTAVAFERPLSSPIMLFLAAIAPAIVVTALVYYASIDRVEPSGSAPSTKPIYEVETDDRGRSKITFGDGPTGATPPSGESNLAGSYPTKKKE